MTSLEPAEKYVHCSPDHATFRDDPSCIGDENCQTKSACDCNLAMVCSVLAASCPTGCDKALIENATHHTEGLQLRIAVVT